MKTEIILDWNDCDVENGHQPNSEGLYFVAIQYGEGAGVYDFVYWTADGGWNLDYEGEVVGFIETQSLKSQLNIRWPSSSHDFRKTAPTPNSSMDGAPWEEA